MPNRFNHSDTKSPAKREATFASQLGEHHVTVPKHSGLKTGTVAGILSDVAGHFGLSREDLLKRLFSR